jgi:hypothetical protein
MNTRTQSTTDHEQRTTPKQDWRLYAAAGAAALAAAGSADAAIIYVDPSVKPTAKLPGAAPYSAATKVPYTFKITPSHAVTAALTIKRYIYRTGDRIHENRAYANAGVGLISHSGNAAKFAAGQKIGNTASQIFGRAGLASNGFSGNGNPVGVGGYFADGQPGFAGFEMPASQGGGLGWIQLQVIDRNNDGLPDEVEALSWAYSTAATESINAGQTTDGSVPEPSALGLLALGSAGVLAWRRRRTVAR